MKKLFWHIFPGIVLLVLVSMLSVGWWASQEVEEFYYKTVSHDLQNRIVSVEQVVQSDTNFSNLKKRLYKIDSATDTRITLIQMNGKVLFDSRELAKNMDNHGKRPEILQAEKMGYGSAIRFSITRNKLMMYRAFKGNLNDSTSLYYRVALPLIHVKNPVGKLFVHFWKGVLLIALFVFLVGWYLSYRIVLPIQKLDEGAKRFAEGDLSRRLPKGSWREIDSLSQSLNQMARRLNKKIRKMIKGKNEMEAVLSSMKESVVAVDFTGSMLHCNRAFRKLVNLDDKTIVKERPLQECIRNSKLPDYLKKLNQTDELLKEDLEITDSNLERKTLAVRGSSLLDGKGKRIGSLIVFNDVTRLRQLEAIRKDFVANVSHELKTPITSIRGFVETLQNGAIEDSENAKKFLDIIRRQSDRMNSIISDLLVLSRIEHGKLGSEVREKIDIKLLLQNVQIDYQVQANEKEIEIQISGDENLVVSGNSNLLELAVGNLLGNAIRYSPAKTKVLLSFKTHSESNVDLFVQDQGAGIEERHLSRLFERFYRVDKVRSREQGGTGLGLAIVKHIALNHGGNVAVESTIGKGSTFHLILPLAKLK